MANTYSSWEYSQGPHLYIDSSGFESIDENKNFVYYYIVTYGPVEYKRKVTNDKGASTYEYKYSFGVDNSSRKQLQRCTFSGKERLTKTVTHSVTEDGFKKEITKTFIIDTNINTNLDTNTQITINPNHKVDTENWCFYNQSTIVVPILGIPYFGWLAIAKTAYRDETYYTTETYSYSYFSHYETYTYYTYETHRIHINQSDGGGGWTEITVRVEHTGERAVYRTGYGTRQVAHTRRVPYTYYETHHSYCSLNLKKVRSIMKDYEKYATATLILKTKDGLNKAPDVYIMTNKDTKEKKTKLTPKNVGKVSCNGIIEYYLPNELINNTFKNYNTVWFMIEKGSCSASNAYIIQAYAYIEIEASSMPYINLLVQSYNKTSDTWSTACVVPYLNYEEIDDMRQKKQHISKNLFLPSDLPKTDGNYRIQLDTNLSQHEAEKFTNFRIDVLSDQLIPPGSIGDRKLYINNDSLEFENEVEVDEVNEIKLNVLGFSTHQKKPYAGFLKQGANDVHAYLKNSVFIIDDNIPENNRSKNVFYSYINKSNGNWVSNKIFAANTFEIGAVNILQGEDDALKDDLIEFKIPYKAFKSNSNYTFIFTVNVEETFHITDIYTVDANDENKVLKSRLTIETDADSSKVIVNDLDYIFYSPPYKLKTKTESELISEYDFCERDKEIRIELNTNTIDPNDSSIMTLKIKRVGIKNIIIKDMQCLCINENDERFIDVFEPYNIDIYTGRQYDTFMTIYYDGFNLEHINPLLYKDMVYLRTELDKIRAEYTLQPYPWSEWTNTYDSNGELITDEEGHGLGVEIAQPLRAVHFNDVKQCCVQTYEDLLALKPPVSLNTSPTQFREGTGLIPLIEEDPSQGYVLQHHLDRQGNVIEIDKYFPEWRQIINLINRN